ncbi:MAG: radical SAM protein [Dehalococcoidia bacterium]
MFSLSLELTNLCNRNCLHCIRDKLEPRESVSLDLVETILGGAKALGVDKIHLTGGEVALYPHLEELIPMIVDCGFHFDLVTNGFRFREAMLPLLTEPKIKRKLDQVCFSLDGARAASHDALRGKGSFKEVMEAATLCRFKEVPISLKSIISNSTKSELTELALLGATLGAENHGFISLLPTPRLIKEKIIPSPQELERIVFWIMEGLAKTIRTKIHIEAYCPPMVLFQCNAFRSINVDHQGNLIFCCTLSHVTDEGRPATIGREFLADLREVSLREGISAHFDLLARWMGQRLKDAENLSPPTCIPCYWCYKYFSKLNWLKNYPESPWAEGVLADDKRE